MPIFGRNVTLQVGQPGAEGLSWTGLRISFRVTKNLGRGANKGTIIAYNLAPASVARFQEPGVVVRLFAGHQIERMIIQGSPVRDGVRGPERRPPNSILTLEVQDGGRELVTSRLNLNFATETTAEQIFDTVAEALGVARGFKPAAFPDVRLTQGVTLNGRAADVLDRLSDMTGTDMTIRDGALEAIPLTTTAGDSAVLLSSANRNLFSIIPKDRGVEVRALLDARIQPGRRFVVESSSDRSLSGIYKARDIEYVGDTHDNEYSMTITAREAA